MAAYQQALNTRYRTKYREILEQFLINNFPTSTTIYPRYSSQSYTVEGHNLRLTDQWQQPSSSSNAFDAFGQEWTIIQPDQQALGTAP